MPLRLLKVGCSKLPHCTWFRALAPQGNEGGWGLGAAQIFKTKSFSFCCNKCSLSCSLHICQDLLQDICQCLLILCLHIDSMFTGCLMWEVSAPRERSGFTVLRESPPSFSASLFPAMISSLQRMRRWTGNTSEAINSCEEGSPKKGVNNLNKAKTHTSMPPGVWQPVWYIESSLSALYAICSHRSWRASQEI